MASRIVIPGEPVTRPAPLFLPELWASEIQRLVVSEAKLSLLWKLAELRKSCGVDPNPLKNGRIGSIERWS